MNNYQKLDLIASPFTPGYIMSFEDKYSKYLDLNFSRKMIADIHHTFFDIYQFENEVSFIKLHI